MAKPYMIRVSSQNGGVGKTIVSVNLAAAISMMKYKVLLIDGDTISPSVWFYLGLKDIKKEIAKADVSGLSLKVMEKMDIRDVISVDKRTGISVLPAVVTTFPGHSEQGGNYVLEKAGELEGYDFIIVDTHSGIYHDSTLKRYDDIVIVSWPTMRSITYAIQFNEICEKQNDNCSLILNRVGLKANEISLDEIYDVFGEKALAELPEDRIVAESEEKQTPAVVLNKNAPFSNKVRELARIYAGRVGWII